MKKPPAPTIVTIAIFTTITIIFWIFFSVYSILISTPEVNISKELLEDIDPTLNEEVLNSLRSMSFYEQGDVNFNPSSITNPAPAENIQEEEIVEEEEVAEIKEEIIQ